MITHQWSYSSHRSSLRSVSRNLITSTQVAESLRLSLLDLSRYLRLSSLPAYNVCPNGFDRWSNLLRGLIKCVFKPVDFKSARVNIPLGLFQELSEPLDLFLMLKLQLSLFCFIFRIEKTFQVEFILHVSACCILLTLFWFVAVYWWLWRASYSLSFSS